MNRAELKNILQEHYDRVRWNKTLQFLSGNRNLLQLSLEPKLIEINTTEADRIVKTFYQVGTLKTSDGVTLPVFEIILEDNIRIEYNKVGVNDFIKKYIIKDAVKGALATFGYETEDRKEWRFSFISKNSASDFFAEAEAEETNPKKYTYIFGTQDEHRTAIERLYNLEQSRFRLEDFFEAFNVEPVSKKFFDEYKKLYQDFSDYLLDEDHGYLAIFENQKDPEHKTEKEARNFVSRLMGRIVFLYFLQKKHWLGASNTEYKDGNPHFLSDLFFNDVANHNDFYEKYLCPIFFNALNTPDRKNDEFKLENGQTVSIPFLNGGLFEEEQEPNGHRNIQFRKDLFESLFNFFNGYNFTIYENSPEEHTVAVDPEMLGHIFENLIDYNKDTGTFYTPKEIVQYMTQESLIEYLNTHLEKERKEIENLVKNQSKPSFSDKELVKIENLLDAVKICDPAIGSGAFPMGMLQEIFNLKALIAYELKKEWNPAEVKQEIIQNSIYGVDLDEGAVEIARLRFWLSLVVDEGMPKALPNLDYKIMQGNSLLESYNGIDLSNLATIDEEVVTEQQTILDFGEDFAKEITVFDTVSIEEIQRLIKSYFNASNKNGKSKLAIKKQLNEIIEGKIHSKIFKEKSKLEASINSFYKKYNLSKNSDLRGFNLKSKELKELFLKKEKHKSLENIEKELIGFQNTEARPYFLWNLYFKEIFDGGGFDIVIGNPPYIKEYTNKSAFDGFRDSPYYMGKMDIWYGFASKGFDILKEKGVECFIAQNNWITSAGASILRKEVLERTEIKQFIDFGDYKVFQSAGIQTMIYLLQKKKNPSKDYNLRFSLLTRPPQNKSQLIRFLDFNTKNDFDEKYQFNLIPENHFGKTISFNNSEIDKILKKIESKGTFKLRDDEVAQGIVAPQDFVNMKSSKLLNSKSKKGDGVFVLSEKELSNFDFSELEKEIIKPYFTSEQLKKYLSVDNNKFWIIYTDSSFKNQRKINDYPKVKLHLDKYQSIITSDFAPYGLHRARNKYFFEGEKIMSIRKCKEPTFTYTDFDCYVSQSYFIIKSLRIDLKYLTLLLNSNLIKFYLKNRGKMQGDIFQIDKEPILAIPIIPVSDDSEWMVIFNYIEEKNVISNSEFVKKLDLMIYKLYGLTFEEVKSIDSSMTINYFQSI